MRCAIAFTDYSVSVNLGLVIAQLALRKWMGELSWVTRHCGSHSAARRRHHRLASSAICVLYPIKAKLAVFSCRYIQLTNVTCHGALRCNAAIAAAFNLPSDIWRSRPSRIASDMKAQAIPSALSRASLGGRQAQSMWVKAEQSNIRVTSAVVQWLT
jgi:hypothetical protein